MSRHSNQIFFSFSLILLLSFPSLTFSFLPIQEIKDSEALIKAHIQDPYHNNFTLSYPSLNLNLTFSNIKPSLLKDPDIRSLNGEIVYINFYNLTSIFITNLLLIDTTTNITLLTIPHFEIEYFFDYFVFASHYGKPFKIGMKRIVTNITFYTKKIEGYELFNELITKNTTEFNQKLVPLYFDFIESILEKYLQGKFRLIFNEMVRKIESTTFKGVSFDLLIHSIEITYINYKNFIGDSNFGKFKTVSMDIVFCKAKQWNRAKVTLKELVITEKQIFLVFDEEEKDLQTPEKIVEELFTNIFNNIQ